MFYSSLGDFESLLEFDFNFTHETLFNFQEIIIQGLRKISWNSLNSNIEMQKLFLYETFSDLTLLTSLTLFWSPSLGLLPTLFSI